MDELHECGVQLARALVAAAEAGPWNASITWRMDERGHLIHGPQPLLGPQRTAAAAVHLPLAPPFADMAAAPTDDGEDAVWLYVRLEPRMFVGCGVCVSNVLNINQIDLAPRLRGRGMFTGIMTWLLNWLDSQSACGGVYVQNICNVRLLRHLCTQYDGRGIFDQDDNVWFPRKAAAVA